MSGGRYGAERARTGLATAGAKCLSLVFHCGTAPGLRRFEPNAGEMWGVLDAKKNKRKRNGETEKLGNIDLQGEGLASKQKLRRERFA